MIHAVAHVPPFAKPRPRFDSRGRGRCFMPTAYRRWQASFRSFLPRLSPPLHSRLGVSIVFATPSGRMRPDIDNAAGAVLDALQPQTIDNDRLVDELRARVVKAKRTAIMVDVYELAEAEAVAA